MLPYWTAPLAAALGNLLICAGVLWTTKPQKLHRVFALLTGTLFLWNLDVFCLYFFEAEADALWWSRLCRPGMFLAPAALYHFVATFRDRRGPLLTILVVLGYLSAALFIVADFQGEMIAGLRRLYSGYWPVMRPPYNGFIAVLLLSFLVFLASLVDEIETAGGKALAMADDLADRAAPARIVNGVANAWGPVEILVNNAGVGSSQNPRPLVEFDDDFWDLTLAVNVTAPYLLTKLVLPAMLEAGWGRIINIASINAKTPSLHGAA